MKCINGCAAALIKYGVKLIWHQLAWPRLAERKHCIVSSAGIIFWRLAAVNLLARKLGDALNGRKISSNIVVSSAHNENGVNVNSIVAAMLAYL